MAKPRDFTGFPKFVLAEVSHLHAAEIGEAFSNPTGLGFVLQKRLEQGKRIISSQTRPGDLILLEAPEPVSEQEFLRHLAPQKLINQLGIARLREYWKQVWELHFNLYAELADFARRTNRRVESIESGLFSKNSRLRNAVVEAYKDPKKFSSDKRDRLDYLATTRRDISMVHRVKAKNPRLVIVADSHALFLRNQLRPYKTIFTSHETGKPGWRGFAQKALRLKKTRREEWERKTKNHFRLG